MGNGRHEDVAPAPNRLDELRIVGVGLDLLAQPADLHVDRAIEGRRLAAACLLEQEVARQHAAGVSREGAQEVELAAGQRHVFAARIGEAARSDVQLPTREAQAVGRGRHRRGSRRRLGRQAPQHRLDPRDQLAQVERLGHVVVGTDLQSHHLVDRVAASRDDDEAAAPVLAHAAGDREAVFAGQAEVQQHEVCRVGFHQRDQGAAVVDLGDAETVALQVVGQQQRDVDFIVEHRDVRGRFHAMARK